jgi:hypothetical protein
MLTARMVCGHHHQISVMVVPMINVMVVPMINVMVVPMITAMVVSMITAMGRHLNDCVR